MSRTRTALAAAGLAALAATTVTAPASASPAKPDTACMRAGIATLKSAGLFSAVAKGGLPIATSVPARPAAPLGRPGRPPGRRQQPVRLPLVLTRTC